MLDRLHGYFLGEVNLAALAKVLRLAERQTAEQQHSRGLGAVAAGFAEGMVDPRIRVTVPAGLGGLTEAVLLPRNVSFLVPGRLLGGSTPKSREHILGFQVRSWSQVLRGVFAFLRSLVCGTQYYPKLENVVQAMSATSFLVEQYGRFHGKSDFG